MMSIVVCSSSLASGMLTISGAWGIDVPLSHRPVEEYRDQSDDSEDDSAGPVLDNVVVCCKRSDTYLTYSTYRCRFRCLAERSKRA